MDPIPADLRPFYAGGYQEIPHNLEGVRQIALQDRYRLDPVLAFRQAGKLLEIGPWMGLFSYNAQQAGFDVTTIEIDQRCVDFMNETIGVRAIQSSDPATTLAGMDEQFDVIVLWHSLEHLHQPWEVLRIAAEHLASGGILLISIPNIESYEFSLLRSAWINLDAPRHLYFFPKHSLVALCERLGLKLVYYTTGDQFSRHFHNQTWFELSRQLIPIKYVRGLMRWMMKKVAWRQERRHESGAGLTAVFQRPG
jgi:2-polyprenyl-3-methyl-5-hydroxy-6-metoxy-1,4-benzoquinol methylase